MQFAVVLALFALIAVAAAQLVAPAIAPGVIPAGFAGGPAAVVGPATVREYHGSPLINGFYSGLVL